MKTHPLIKTTAAVIALAAVTMVSVGAFVAAKEFRKEKENGR